jgi:hypothetical protein
MADAHLTTGSTITRLGDRIVIDCPYESTTIQAETKAAESNIGWAATGAIGLGTGVIDNALGIVRTGLRVSEREGGLATTNESISVLLKVESWNVDFAEISKDIRTWISSPNNPDAVYGTEAARQLACLRNWENLAEVQDWEHYSALEYATGATYAPLPTPADIVAQKILKGVQSYSIYAPVVTRTTVWPFKPDVTGRLGKIDTPASRDGWTSYNGETYSFTGLADSWLKNVERSSSNGDGTFTLTEGWLGADEVDADLYGTGAA